VSSIFKCSLCGLDLDQTQVGLCDDCKSELKKNYCDIFSNQPKQQRNIDQFAMDFDSIISQNLFLRQSFKGNTVAFFGGYDGVGLLSSFFGEKGVLVFDIVQEVLDWWQKTGNMYGFEVIPILYDARDPVQEEIIDIVKSFTIDAWRTDPPFNCAGQLCFLTRILKLDLNKSPIFLCLPDGNPWSRLKHNVWKFIKDSGLKITNVSPEKYHYTHIEGPDSFAWKIEMESQKFLIPNEQFRFNIYHPTIEFAESPWGCKQYEYCKASRKKWNQELDRLVDI